MPNPVDHNIHAQPCHRFKHMFVGVKPMLDVALVVGIGVSAVDACFLQHTHYRSGQLHIISTKDGNNHLRGVSATPSLVLHTNILWTSAKSLA